MANEPWFKFYSADYLLDSAVDALPLEAQGILVRMWCLCHSEGFCPVESEEIARKTRLPAQSVVKHREQLSRFFNLRDGRLYSRRMEAERQKSQAARENANRRWHRGNADRKAARTAESDAQIQSQSQSQSQSQNQNQGQIENPPPSTGESFDLSLQGKKKQFSQRDYDERDLRKFAVAGREIELKLTNGWGAHLTQEQIFAYQCERAGVTANRMREVFARIDQEECGENRSRSESRLA